ncbi:MAG: sugar phosphate isomerase/epimerase family protein [Phycisphaerales bacterium JB040]
MQVALSSVAYPELTLGRFIDEAARIGYHAVELRTFGTDSNGLASDAARAGGVGALSGDPLLTSASKLRRLALDAGLEVLSLASSIAFDEPIFPPVIGRLRPDLEESVARTKALVEHGAKARVRFVRVFGHEVQPGEPMNRALRRILERLDLAARTTRHTGVRLLMESGGSFSTAAPLRRLVSEASTPNVVAAYNVAGAWLSGENPVEGVSELWDHLEVVKLSDVRNEEPRALGEGDVPVAETVRALAARGFNGALVYELPRLWTHRDVEPAPLVETALERILTWWGEGQPATPRAAAAV